MPIGILGSLAICTMLYIAVAGVLTGVVELHPAQCRRTRSPWACPPRPALGRVSGAVGTMLGLEHGDAGDAARPIARVLLDVARRPAAANGPAPSTPASARRWISLATVGVFVAILPALFPIDVLGHMTNIGTLLAFVIVCAGVGCCACAGRICIAPSRRHGSLGADPAASLSRSA